MMKHDTLELYFFSKVDDEWLFTMSSKIIDNKISVNLIYEIQKCNDLKLLTKLKIKND